jgi:hypothetical protein
MKVALPNHTWAIIKSKGEISERVSRELSRALLESAAVTHKLTELGFDDSDAGTYHLFSQLTEQERSDLTAIQTVLIRSFVTQWYWEAEINDTTIEDLPAQCYEALALECLNAWTAEDDALDPKADTAA